MTRKELEAKYRTDTPNKFVSFMNSVKNARLNHEMTAFEVQSMMCNLIDEQIDECRRIGSLGKSMTAEQKDIIVKSARLIACCMTILAETRSKTEMRSRALLLLEYASYTTSSNYDLAGTAIKCLSYNLINPGFSWSLLETCTSTDMIVYKMISGCEFDEKDKFPTISFNGAGSIIISGGEISVSSAPLWESSIESFSILNDALEICTRSSKDERLKVSETEDIQALESFSRIYQLAQNETKKLKAPSLVRKLTNNAKYPVKIKLCKDNDGEYLGCYPLGTSYDGIGEIKEEELVKGTYTSDLIALECFFDDDCIEAARLVDDNEPPIFSIKEAYQKYAKKIAENDLVDRRIFKAKISAIYRNDLEPEKNRLILVSDKGYGGLMRDYGKYKEGDEVIVYVISVNGYGGNLFINMDEPSFAVPNNLSDFDNNDALADFTTIESNVALDAEDKSAKGNAEQVELVRRFGRILSRDNRGSSIDKYKSKLASAFISGLIEDDPTLIWSLSRAEYLCQCLRVSEGIPVKAKDNVVDLTEDERSIIETLSKIETVDNASSIASLIQTTYDKPLENKIARILMALSLSSSMPDEVKTKPEDARREICKIIGVADHLKAASTKGGGKYGFGELANVEFKSSYVMRNDGKGADIDYQGRGQVFEAVCGMLNAEGGTVYVGVNNSGDPLVADGYGVNGDLKWFEANFGTIKLIRSRQLRHPIPQPKDLDSYCLFLNDEKSLYFKPSVLSNITISPTEDYDAIKIIVKPSEFEIAKLYKDNSWSDGVVYMRDGGETVPMSRNEQERRLMKLRSVGKIEQFILTLADAIDNQYKVILKDYYSSNSNERRDRFVVPINLVYNNENLWAYDIEKKECREFRLARVSALEVIQERYSHAFEEGKADVFRWIAPSVNYHIKLKLSISAVNTLIEDFSNARNLPKEELYQISPERWILDTYVHGWGATVRFYVGNCGSSKKDIEILDTEDSEALRNEVKEYLVNIKV